MLVGPPLDNKNTKYMPAAFNDIGKLPIGEKGELPILLTFQKASN
jgi:hypothetical protein